MNRACYRKLKSYKYQLMSPYTLKIGISGYEADTPFLKLQSSGMLEIKKGYAWDGPSGPTIDTKTFMRGSLVHDVLYQLIRMTVLPYRYKEFADLLLQKICLEDGMSKFRAGYVYKAVKYFGASSAKPREKEPDKIYCVP